MRQILTLAMALTFAALAFISAASAQGTEKRIALVIGNAAYQAAPLKTSANDAGLIAQTLQAAGFDVVGARDLDQDSLRRAFHDFLEKAQAAGPDTVAFIYLSGYGLQLEGENYFVPVDAKIDTAADVSAEAIRVSDYLRPLEALKLKANIFVLDGARANPFARKGSPLAGGLALVDPQPGTLIAFNAAPGTIGPEGQGNYGAYAQALAEMMRDGGLSLADVFDRTRLRVNEMTKGAEVPWDASKVDAAITFFMRAPDAPPPPVTAERVAELRSRPIRDLGAREAYLAALDRDTLQGYLDFLAAYPDDPMARRVRAIVAARREAITWHQTWSIDTPRAYWSYLRRYPHGLHAYDARRRLAYLEAQLEPPQSFEAIEYDVPPPPPDEIIYVDRPVIYFDDPDFDFLPPPPPPVIFLPPPPVYIVELPPPPPPIFAFVLPMPIYHPVPLWVHAPAYVALPPPNNIIFNNIHNTVVINSKQGTAAITNPSGQMHTFTPPVPHPLGVPGGKPGLPPTAAVIGPALPPSVAHKVLPIQNQVPGGQAAPPVPGKPLPPKPLGAPLPGMKEVTPGKGPGPGKVGPGGALPKGLAPVAPHPHTPLPQGLKPHVPATKGAPVKPLLKPHPPQPLGVGPGRAPGKPVRPEFTPPKPRKGEFHTTLPAPHPPRPLTIPAERRPVQPRGFAVRPPPPKPEMMRPPPMPQHAARPMAPRPGPGCPPGMHMANGRCTR